MENDICLHLSHVRWPHLAILTEHSFQSLGSGHLQKRGVPLLICFQWRLGAIRGMRQQQEWSDVSARRPHHTSYTSSSHGFSVTSFSDESLCRLFLRHVGLMKFMLRGMFSVPTSQSGSLLLMPALCQELNEGNNSKPYYDLLGSYMWK